MFISRPLLCFILFLSLFVDPSRATNYFFSSSIGNDSNSGTSHTTPWQNINDKLLPLLPALHIGDVVNFCMGDRWFLSGFTAQAPGITYQSYQCHTGILSRPQITTAHDLPSNGWKPSLSNPSLLIFNLSSDSVASANGISALWVGTTRYSLARWPNMAFPSQQITWGVTATEFHTLNAINGVSIDVSQITSNFSTGFFAGMTIQYRPDNWYWSSGLIVNSSTGLLEMSASGGTQSAISYYLEASITGHYPNNMWLLDNIGEFLYINSTLYLFPMSSSINSAIQSGSLPVSILYGNSGNSVRINSEASNSSFLGLEFTQGNTAMQTLASNLTINDCAFTHSLGNGMNVASSQHIIVSYNVFNDIESSCWAGTGSTVMVSFNQISNCGLWARDSQEWNGITLYSCTALGNNITNVGYSGIEPHVGATADSNLITNAMMTLNDGQIFILGFILSLHS